MLRILFTGIMCVYIYIIIYAGTYTSSSSESVKSNIANLVYSKIMKHNLKNHETTWKLWDVKNSHFENHGIFLLA